MIPLFLLTYNCAKRQQKSDHVKQFLLPNLPKEPPNLIVLGFEELAPVMDGCFAAVNDYLQHVVVGAKKAIESKYSQKYYDAGKCVKGAIAIVVLALEDVEIARAVPASAGIGWFRSSLKGAAAMRIHVKSPIDAEFTFVNAHLAANEGQTVQRNADFLTIAQTLDFKDGYGLYKPGVHLFFMGDLNYRALSNVIRPHRDVSEDAERLISDIDYSQLNQYDELTREKAKGATLFRLQEAPIEFPPTYKFIVNTKEYDFRRIPSWCDRILYQQYPLTPAPIVHLYADIETPTNSDHRPVYLSISVPSDPPKNPISAGGYLDNGMNDVYLGLSAYQPITSVYGNVSDKAIGWGIYLSTTNSGRKRAVYGLSALLALYLVYVFM